MIKKSDDEGKDYYYMGQVDLIESEKPKQTTIIDDEGKERPVVNIKYKLHYPVKEELYNYLINDIE